jgi:ABC-type nickel/cobalt efflux system permease component RcnA
VRVVVALGIVGILSIAIGGTLLTIMLLASNSVSSSPIPFVIAIFLAFLLVGLGLWLIVHGVKQKKKQNQGHNKSNNQIVPNFLSSKEKKVSFCICCSILVKKL